MIFESSLLCVGGFMFHKIARAIINLAEIATF